VAAPLIFIGGLVTSTNSGMAVPDWPGTYGSNMFLYPLGPRAQALDDSRTRDVFLEHSHRLFGTLLGLSTLVLMVWALLAGTARTARVLVVLVFLLVCVQGLLGGLRVRLDSRVVGLAHGVLAQVVLAMLVMLALVLGPARGEASSLAGLPLAKRARVLAAAAMHATLLQLVFGAVFRQFRHSDHTLWSHAGFAVVVAVLATVASLASLKYVQSSRASGHDHPLFPMLQRCASAMLIVVLLQFALGWASFLFGAPREYTPANAAQALLRTAHQANGAALLALGVLNWFIARRLTPKRATT
jgi:cytochrome c oxidase assembly protein subunit 15